MRNGWVVRAPGSSANVGAAFDAVAIALAAHLEVSDTDDNPAPETHPAARAFRSAVGVGPISVRSQIPGGRGLGFSGAARVAGLLAAHTQHERPLPDVTDGRSCVATGRRALPGVRSRVARVTATQSLAQA